MVNERHHFREKFPMTQFVTKIYWSPQLQIIKWTKEGSPSIFTLRALEKARIPGREDRSPDISPTSILSPGFTALVFHKLIHIPEGLEKQMVTGSGTQATCAGARGQFGHTQRTAAPPETCPLLALITPCWTASEPRRCFLWRTKFIRITSSPLDSHRLHFSQVGFPGVLSRFFHEAHQWEINLCSTHQNLPCCWKNKSGYLELRSFNIFGFLS